MIQSHKNIFIRTTQRYGFFAITLLVSGCTGMNSNFTCPMTPDHMCSSLDTVNTMIDQGRVGGNTPAGATASDKSQNLALNTGAGYPMTSGIQPGDPLR